MVNQSSPATEGYRDQFPGEYSWNGYDNSSAVCLVLGTQCEMETILDIFGYTATSISGLTDNDVLRVVNDANLTENVTLESIIGLCSLYLMYFVIDFFVNDLHSETPLKFHLNST